ncbi:MAG: hypothetical protein K2X48_01370 [Chitinophagaceae bacterium]|nr:hypothetical protein [Chitinophagaceae bacterium]
MSVNGQANYSIKGFVFSSSDKSPLQQASVVLYKLIKDDDKEIVSFSFSKKDGSFIVTSKLFDTCSYVLIASHVNFDKEEKKIHLLSDSLTSLNFFLIPSETSLKEIVIESKAPVRIKNDTIEFKADSFRNVQTRKVEDLLRNIEGFKVEADGRITYRGKEVKALLLDGDDLTQDQYQLLTRNLNADIVDKLQVIDNYNKNRIMGGLLESNQAAINLKLKKGLQGKLNGSVTGAASPEGRYEGDVSLVWLKAKFKMIGLFNANNIAKDATGLLRYQQFGNAGGLQQQGELTKKIVNGTGLINSGTVAAPDISREYVLDNRNLFSSPLFHTRINKTLKLAFRFYGVSDQLFFNGGNSSFTTLNQQNRWSLTNNQQSEIKRQNISGAAELSHDNLKKFAGHLNLQAGWVKDDNRFTNQTTGFFTDTLSENINATRWGYTAAYNGAVKLNEYQVLSLQSNVSFIPERKQFETQTNRLHLFYNRPDSFRFFNQSTNADVLNWQSNISVFRKKGSKTLKVGYENSLQNLTIYNDVTSQKKLLSSVNREIVFLQNRLSLQTVKQFTAKSSIKLNFSPGIGSVSDNSQTGKNKNFILWKLSAGYTYKIKAFSGFNFLVSTVKELPNPLLFHPANMINANASVITGGEMVKPVEAYTANVSFSNFKIISKQSLLISTNVRFARTDYAGNILLLPQYNVTTWGMVNNNRQAGVNIDFGSFVFPLNSTFRVSSFASFSINNQLLNTQPVENKTSYGGFTFTWVPSFKMPVGWQIDFSKSFFYNEQTNQSIIVKNNNQTTNILIKLRSAFKGNYYAGTQYNYLQLSPQQQFHLWSLFQNIVINKNLNADFVVHNLLNNRLYAQRNNTVNVVNENTFTGIGRYLLLKINWSF